MVLQRLNQEIERQGGLHERGLPHPQSLQSIDGLEMFGFLSSPIIQVKLLLVQVGLFDYSYK